MIQKNIYIIYNEIMRIKRITFRIPQELWTRVKILAKENNISLNKQLIELIEFGIQAFISKTKN